MEPVPAMVTMPGSPAVAPASAMTASSVTTTTSAGRISLQDGLLVFRTAAHAEAGGREAHGARVEAGFGAGRGHGVAHGAHEFVAALRGSRVIARAATARAEHVSGFIADQRGGAGLSAIHSQEKSHR
jgi:hypothetical protein